MKSLGNGWNKQRDIKNVTKENAAYDRMQSKIPQRVTVQKPKRQAPNWVK